MVPVERTPTDHDASVPPRAPSAPRPRCQASTVYTLLLRGLAVRDSPALP